MDDKESKSVEKPLKERKTPASIFSNTGVYSVPGKVRWQSTTAQLERLEQLFAIDTTTPRGEKLKQVTEELSALGPIQECNVFNWFQNKKSRLKKLEEDAAREKMEAAANTRSRDSDDMENGTVVEPEIEKEEQDSEIDKDLRLLWEKMKVEKRKRPRT
jgi:hypothetical protein